MTSHFFFSPLHFALSALGGSAVSQEPAKVPVVAILVTHAAVDDPIFDSLREGLRQLGYEEGRNIRLEIVTAGGQLERLPNLASEMIRRRVDLIVAPNEVSTRVAMKATGTIPIVMVGAQDMIRSGTRSDREFPPDWRQTSRGCMGNGPEMEAKRLELVKELLPGTSLVAVLWEGAFGRSALADLQSNAQHLGMRLELIEIAGAGALDAAFKTAKRKKVGATAAQFSGLLHGRVRIGTLACRLKSLSFPLT